MKTLYALVKVLLCCSLIYQIAVKGFSDYLEDNYRSQLQKNIYGTVKHFDKKDRRDSILEESSNPNLLLVIADIAKHKPNSKLREKSELIERYKSVVELEPYWSKAWSHYASICSLEGCKKEITTQAIINTIKYGPYEEENQEILIKTIFKEYKNFRNEEEIDKVNIYIKKLYKYKFHRNKIKREIDKYNLNQVLKIRNQA